MLPATSLSHARPAIDRRAAGGNAAPDGAPAAVKGEGNGDPVAARKIWFRYGPLMEKVSLSSVDDVADLRSAIHRTMPNEFSEVDAVHLTIVLGGATLAPDRSIADIVADLDGASPGGGTGSACIEVRVPRALRWPYNQSMRPDALAQSPFQLVPCEVIERILAHAGPRGARSAAQVCRCFAEVARSGRLWERMCLAALPSERAAFFGGIERVCQDVFGGDWRALWRRCAPMDRDRIARLVDVSQIAEPTRRLLRAGAPDLFTWIVPVNVFEAPSLAAALRPSERSKHCVYSPTFTRGGVRWRLLIFPRSVQNDDRHLSVFLDCQDATALDVKGQACRALFGLFLHAHPWRTPVVKARPLQYHCFSEVEPDWGYANFVRTSEVLTQYIALGKSAHVRIDVAIFDTTIVSASERDAGTGGVLPQPAAGIAGALGGDDTGTVEG